jgi:hypothetical protein
LITRAHELTVAGVSAGLFQPEPFSDKDNLIE